jgi:hypothetical protein
LKNPAHQHKRYDLPETMTGELPRETTIPDAVTMFGKPNMEEPGSGKPDMEEPDGADVPHVSATRKRSY